REAAEREGGAPQRGVLLGQPGQFLATARTVISHTHSPFRSSRTFERDDIHTGHNECGRRTVRWPPDAPPRLIKPAMVSLPVEAKAYQYQCRGRVRRMLGDFAVCVRPLSQKGTFQCSILS